MHQSFSKSPVKYYSALTFFTCPYSNIPMIKKFCQALILMVQSFKIFRKLLALSLIYKFILKSLFQYLKIVSMFVRRPFYFIFFLNPDSNSPMLQILSKSLFQYSYRYFKILYKTLRLCCLLINFSQVLNRFFKFFPRPSGFLSHFIIYSKSQEIFQDPHT
jgi:hypothetical protein